VVNNYLLSYSTLTGRPSEGQLLNHVRISRHVLQYYQPFFGTYIIKSDQPIFTVTEGFKGLFEENPFMLTQLFANMSGGSLPPEIWHWINHGFIPAPAAPTPAPTNVFGGLLGSTMK
jgi:hypothetical protein